MLQMFRKAEGCNYKSLVEFLVNLIRSWFNSGEANQHLRANGSKTNYFLNLMFSALLVTFFHDGNYKSSGKRNFNRN